MNSSINCPCCGHNGLFEVLKFSNVPVSGVFRDSAEESMPANELAFDACEVCGLLRNRNFANPPDYLEKPRSTARQLPTYLDDLLDVVGQYVSECDLILEVGSNDGSFLDALRDNGFCNVYGIEPSTELVKIARTKGHSVVGEYFGTNIVDMLVNDYGAPKMIICRHTLEHVPYPNLFIQALEQLLRRGNGVALIEIPDSTAILEGLNFVEFWDEHLYYFTPDTLSLLMKRCGLTVDRSMVFSHLDTRNALVVVRADKDVTQNDKVNDVELWKSFSLQFKNMSKRIKRAVQTLSRPVYLIGASHPQCNFINYMDLESSIDFMIDDDSVKVGKLPSIRSDLVRVISSNDFLSRPEGGTLILTGFGYSKWTQQLCNIARTKGIDIFDPANC